MKTFRCACGNTLYFENTRCLACGRELGLLPRYYAGGARAGWQERFVSAYASAHPWEDWTECWAHLLQIADALETAVAIGMAPPEAESGDLDDRIAAWVELAMRINLLNRSLDQPDPYPFVPTPPVVEKLRVVDAVIHSSGFSGSCAAPSPGSGPLRGGCG
jgi:hypothetical protein